MQYVAYRYEASSRKLSTIILFWTKNTPKTPLNSKKKGKKKHLKSREFHRTLGKIVQVKFFTEHSVKYAVYEPLFLGQI